jgi:hypothetical protein
MNDEDQTLREGVIAQKISSIPTSKNRPIRMFSLLFDSSFFTGYSAYTTKVPRRWLSVAFTSPTASIFERGR